MNGVTNLKIKCLFSRKKLYKCICKYNIIINYANNIVSYYYVYLMPPHPITFRPYFTRDATGGFLVPPAVPNIPLGSLLPPGNTEDLPTIILQVRQTAT